MHPAISIIIPLYNEEEVFPLLKERLQGIMKSPDYSLEIVMVDDGSTDSTPALMEQLAVEDGRFQAVFLSRNFGHQQALSAGLMHVRATEAVMIIDGDLQDPPELVFDFFRKLKEGYDVVYAVRRKRKEGLLKKLAYFLFYRIQRRMTNIRIHADSGDFCMMSTRVVRILNDMPEDNRFLRGMRSWVGFKQYGFEYERAERKAGRSKYSLRMLVNLAYNGIFNFSALPIRFITSLGLYAILLSLGYLTYTLVRKFWFDDVPSGFTGILVAIIMLGGVQLISIGVVGEYVVRIFQQTKGRPRFIVKEHIVDQKSVTGI
ncbi:MAG: glycosyltransferase family 2 protein [Flavobacteriales bacterium]|nr:glycosyltransferase family 2 protein [Flavobacteriales bacterium]